MAAPQPDAFARVVHRFATAGKLDAAKSMLNWDAQTHMPANGAWARGEQMAAITEVSADLVGSRAAADELGEAEAMATALEPDERADLFEMRRTHLHTASVPKELLAAKARATQVLQSVWTKAKPANDWAAFEPGFAEVLALTREVAQAKAEALGTSLYGALLDQFDPGVGEAMIDPIFADLSGFLPGMIAEVLERQAAWPDPIPFGDVPIAQQAALSHKLAVAVGHDPDAFRIDAAPHPFSVPHSPGDVRFTTRYDVANVQFALHATLHEAGHAMYEFNLPRAFAFRPGGVARGMTVHESQSLSLEKMCGRSAEFLGWLAPMLAAEYGGDPARWSASNVLNRWRRLDDGYIRVEADELSYPLHVILRYRLEQALISGDLKPADVPGAWSEAFTKLLGRTPPDLAHGCLQDIHWAAGLIGYFPNYAMGSMLAAQFFERATADDPEILPALGRGDFGPYFAWVKPRVHERASLVSFEALVREATGGPLTAEAFKRHVKRRYLEETAPG
ncbi:MAG TPA: carboxypeptidase M32 [Caulobacteraceae bacterium]|jgi:carboxypeptidase Taq|nr:carboxypeptidase M32 [Caulobacteraceae bacterium]